MKKKKSKYAPTGFDVAGYKFFSLALVLLTLFLIIRIFEYVSIVGIHQLPEGSIGFEVIGFVFDILFMMNVVGVLLIPYILLYLIHPKLGTGFFILLIALISVIYVSLSQYFITLLVPLGKDLFGYTKAEVLETIQASVDLKISTFLPFVLFIGLMIFLIWLYFKIKIGRIGYLIFMGLSIISVIFYRKITPKSVNFDKEAEYFLVINKANFLTYQGVSLYSEKNRDEYSYVNTYIDEETDSIFKEGTYNLLSKEYPLLRYDDSIDVLGKFFNVDSLNPPNFVFIIVESLGRAFSGPKAYLGNFTPFLDSLMKHSLYWENFLATGGRTFAVLPAMFVSAPIGNKGLLELGNNMPDHQSLIRLLTDRGYYSTFYYGGKSNFDNQDIFFRRQKISKIVDENDFPANYRKMPSNEGGFSWGYGDYDLFRRSFEILNSHNKSPRLDIFLTISLHSPFKVLNQQKYIDQFETLMEEYGMGDAAKEDYRKYTTNSSCDLYTDDAIRYLINEYKKRDDFKNTIFIITGDHRMIPIPHSTIIDRFHVPLIIYSPMLKGPHRFKSISTHRDIAPSIVQFMRFSYQMEFPPVVHWLSSGLDVKKKFRNVHSLPLMRTKNSRDDYIDGEYYLSDGVLYMITDRLDVVQTPEADKLEELKSKLNKFLEVNDYVVTNNKMMPDSLYRINIKK